MITDVFPKAGGTPLTMKTMPYVKDFSVSVPRNSTMTDSLQYEKIARQRMAIGANGSLYLLGQDYYNGIDHFARVTWNPLTGYTKEWSIDNVTPVFDRVVSDDNDFAYVTRGDGTLEKYNAAGEVLWSITESGVLCIGANGNLFVWAATYIKEYDTDGNLLNTWEYTCTGTPITFYANADKDFFIATSSQLARVTSALEVVWTYSTSFSTSTYSSGTFCAVDIDESGNFYMYGSSNLSVKCISSEGVQLWDTGQLQYSDMYRTIWVDNLGSVYAINYSSYLFKLDAKTGNTIWKKQGYQYNGYRTGCADKHGNVYVWYEHTIYGWHEYLGTVNWTENEEVQEKFAIQEVERGDDYMILLSDEEVVTS